MVVHSHHVRNCVPSIDSNNGIRSHETKNWHKIEGFSRDRKKVRMTCRFWNTFERLHHMIENIFVPE